MVINGVLMNIFAVYGCSVVILTWLFRFFIIYNPFWKKNRRIIKVNNVIKYRLGVSVGNRFCLLETDVDGQTRYLFGNRDDYIGKKIEVLVSSDLIVKKKFNNIDSITIVFFLSTTAIYWNSYVFVLRYYFLQYVLLIIFSWILFPFLYQRYYAYVIKNYLDGIRFDEKILFAKEFWVGDMKEDKYGTSKMVFIMAFFIMMVMLLMFGFVVYKALQ